jgi:hypothetical protein
MRSRSTKPSAGRSPAGRVSVSPGRAHCAPNSPPRQHVILGIAPLEVLRLLFAFRQLLDAFFHIVGKLLVFHL